MTPEGLKKNALYLLQQAAEMEGEEHFEEHQIEFTEDGWTIRHPVSEAIFGSLFECDVKWWPMEDPNLRGVYVLHANRADGKLSLVVGPRVGQ